MHKSKCLFFLLHIALTLLSSSTPKSNRSPLKPSMINGSAQTSTVPVTNVRRPMRVTSAHEKKQTPPRTSTKFIFCDPLGALQRREVVWWHCVTQRKGAFSACPHAHRQLKRRRECVAFACGVERREQEAAKGAVDASCRLQDLQQWVFALKENV